MKKTPLKRIGKVGKANIKARKIIADICREKNLTQCEMQLEGCLLNWPLAPAHRHKRAWYKGDADLLSDFKQWVVACQACHDWTEFDRALNEEMFNKLRP